MDVRTSNFLSQQTPHIQVTGIEKRLRVSMCVISDKLGGNRLLWASGLLSFVASEFNGACSNRKTMLLHNQNYHLFDSGF